MNVYFSTTMTNFWLVCDKNLPSIDQNICHKQTTHTGKRFIDNTHSMTRKIDHCCMRVSKIFLNKLTTKRNLECSFKLIDVT